MYRALYRDFRPDTFEELIGQDHIVRILQSQIAAGSISHAYLFCGTRGTGKTTTARILAKALNCEDPAHRPCCQCDTCRAIRDGSFIDVMEIDAASNNGVDNIRDLRDSINYPPVVGKYKIYIIDEVHMLSTGAFNALLKTLEEPPSYVVFILATTEPQKIPATILSRCVRLDFRRVSEQRLIENMGRICAARGVEAEEAALSLIAIHADGSVRDSLSILEQCLFPGEPLRREDVARILGTAGEEALIALTDAVTSGDGAAALLQLDRMIASGIDVRLLMKQWLEHFRNLLLVKYVEDPTQMLSMSMENAARVGRQAAAVSTAFLDRSIRELTETIAGTRWSSRPRVMLEMSAVKLSVSQESEEAFRFRYDGGWAAGGAAASPVAQAAGQAGAAPGTGAVFEVPRAPQAEAAAQPAFESRPAAPERDREDMKPLVPEDDREAQDPAPDPMEKPDASDGLWEAADIYEDGLPPADWNPVLDATAPEPPVQDARSDSPGRPEAGAFTTSGASAPETAEDALDDQVWQEVMDMAASRRGIFTRFIGRSHLTRADGEAFYIDCADKDMEDFLRNRGRELVEELMTRRAGRPLRLAFETRKARPAAEEEKPDKESNKAALEEFFGVPVEIE